VTIRRILTATDFSDASLPAARAARAWAQALGAELTVVTVLEPLPGYFAPHLSSAPGGIMEQLAVGLRKELADYARANFVGVDKVTTEVVVGKTADAIIDAAVRGGAELVIVGTHGRGGLAHAVLGSTAETILRRCPVPVLTVPAKFAG